jgi:hypothetical protein
VLPEERWRRILVVPAADVARVIGWTASGQPVVVPNGDDGLSRQKVLPRGMHVMDDDSLNFRLPEVDVSSAGDLDVKIKNEIVDVRNID